MAKLIAPIVHNNGTSADSLLKQYTEALSAVNTAIEAVRMIETHDRDYYVHPEVGAGPKAREQKTRWSREMSFIYRELMAIAHAIHERHPYTEGE